MTLTVVIPGTPHSDLRPNSTKHRMTKGRHRARLKRDAYYATIDALNSSAGIVPSQFAAARYGIVIHWEKGRKMQDPDGALGSCKSLLDGIAAAIGVDDKYWMPWFIDQTFDPDGKGYVRVEVEAG